MNPDSAICGFHDFEDLMKSNHLFARPANKIGKGKGGKAECKGKAECPEGKTGKRKGKSRNKNQIVETYYVPMEDTFQAWVVVLNPCLTGCLPSDPFPLLQGGRRCWVMRATGGRF